MKEVVLDYGDGKMRVQLPDSAVVIRHGETYRDPPAVDPAEATRNALANPLGALPLRELARPGMQVRIAFPDQVKGGSHPLSHRRVAIPIIVEELKRAGVRDQDLKLICGVGLHRKNTRDELERYLGRDVVAQFWPDRLLMHDGEDPAGMVELGTDEMGNVANFNREMAECDLPILIGHVQGNPHGGYSGGYKMCVTGLTGWRSIASHHSPSTMHRDDFLPVNTDRSLMRRQFDSIGAAIERGIGKRLFVVDAVLGSNTEVLGVYAGAPDAVQAESWKLADRRTNVYLEMDQKADVLVYGLPRTFQYGPGMGSNPLLMLQAIGSQLVRSFDLFNEGGVIIAPAICDGWFNEAWFGAYVPAFQKLQELHDFAEIARFQEELATDPEHVHRFRFQYAYHPFHPLAIIFMGAIAHQRASAVFIPGARKPGYARAMGCIPTGGFDEALKRAERYVGRNPRILAIPEAFTKVGVHLRRA